MKKIYQWQKIIFLEAVGVQGHHALLAEEESLVVFLALNAALLAVPPLGGTLAVQVGGHHPVVHAIVPGPVPHPAAEALLHRHSPMLLKHLQHQLAEKEQQGLLVPSFLRE